MTLAMQTVIDDVDDAARVRALEALALLDTPAEERFDRLTRLASAALNTPIALVSLVDLGRQWFKSRVGLAVAETPRSMAFCSHAVAGRELLVVPDTLRDARFSTNPLVTQAPKVRFYAGQPIFSLDGHAVGTLCVLDTVPRAFSAAESLLLRDLASLVESELNKNALVSARQAAEQALQQFNAELEARIGARTASLQESNRALTREVAQRKDIEDTLRQSEARNRTIIESSLSAFVSIDTRGCIVDWNAAAEHTFGWTRADVLGLDLATTIIPQRFRAAHHDGMARYLSSGVGRVLNQRIELPACKKSGEEITVEMAISAFPTAEGVLFGAFLHDISARLDAQGALQEQQKQLDAVLDTIDVGVVACTADGRINLFNHAMRDIHGLAHDHAATLAWAVHDDMFRADGVTPLAPGETPLHRSFHGEVVQDYPLVIARDGYKRSFLASGRRLLDAEGARIGAVVAMKDVTDLALVQHELKLNEQRLLAITENLPTLIGQIDRSGVFVFLNSRAARFFGMPREQLLGQPVRMAYSDAEFAKVGPHIETAMGGTRASFEGDMTVEGRLLSYYASYIPNLDADGKPNGFFAMAFDISERKASEIRQRDSEERLRTITDNLPILISYIDRDTRFQFANAMHTQWYGVCPAELIGKTVEEVFGREFCAPREAYFYRCLEGETVQLDIAIANETHNRVLNILFIPHKRGDAVLGAYVLSTDVTATWQHEHQLTELANTDALTGLHNRRHYEVLLAAAIERAGRSKRPMALVYLDIDHFKTINDTLGHAGGDEVLKQFSRRLNGAVRKTDTVCRLAGDEFTIILENVDSVAECETIGQKLVASMTLAFDILGHPWNVSASIGIAWCAHQAATAQVLATHADTALYSAKHAGKNQYRVAGVP